MIFDALDYYGLTHDIAEAGFYKTKDIERLQSKIKQYVLNYGKLIVINGSVGSGKTTLMNQLMQELIDSKKCIVSYSYSSDRERVTVKTLLTALLLDLRTNDTPSIPSSSELRDRAFVKLMQEHNKPVVLFIDEAQDLHGNTLSSLKKLSEMARKSNQKFSIILAGQPKLKNVIQSPKMEEVGFRAYVIDLDVLFVHKEKYFQWALSQCIGEKKISEVITPDALKLLAESLQTPMQIISFFNKAMEIGFKAGVKPIDVAVINEAIRPKGLQKEIQYSRAGYKVSTLAKMLHTSEKIIDQWFAGKLSEQQSDEIEQALIQANIVV